MHRGKKAASILCRGLSFEFRAHPVGPQVQLCAPFYPLEEGRKVLRAWRDFTASAPDEVNSIAIPWSVPDAEGFPPELRRRPVVITAAVYAGPAEEGARVMQPLRDIGRADLTQALLARLDWKQRAQLDTLAPTHVVVPSGARIAIDYADPSAPALRVRVQEMYGVAATPTVGGGRVPLTLHLLSPAQRPVQVTRDLAAFWRGSYAEVRKHMRGRYPKHKWP